ncbi:hypothetical protein AGABI1DRAFT_116734 [Agaricus bisporus var. burnettii JB137-S8]|uniref:NAD(P)-binding protein n=1 Tax=Agaricus bisporus var. burnettii (strain JB137-S8 / ATCC MYA-4627 / FGSC 10392) TaxID=597362 RepID=K5WW17_AGABU|nr:uncharacterized protein AGABI1DRAFT_116734 [Agaricus bisporus var. burnettii JB137-S8]EKM74757.1 hypothetical protein AGABI1DRAFT_116734 [Agaricus bisporus var. burnettii JB137-S8]
MIPPTTHALHNITLSLATVLVALASLGPTNASIHLKQINLKDASKIIKKAIGDIDKTYGPLTHLYAVSGISNHLDPDSPWDLQVTEAMISVNISGTVTAVLSAYELMKERSYGKICIVGSLAGYYSPANMISYASTKAFINTFAINLRSLAAPYGVDVTTVAPGLIKSRMTDQMRSQGSTVPAFEYESTSGMASAMVHAVETGGIPLVAWPWRQSLIFYSLQALNPICDSLGRFIAFKARLTGKKIT